MLGNVSYYIYFFIYWFTYKFKYIYLLIKIFCSEKTRPFGISDPIDFFQSMKIVCDVPLTQVDWSELLSHKLISQT